MPRRRRTIAVAYPRDPATDERVRAVAARAAERERLADATERWRPLAATAEQVARDAPTLALDDYSRIPFVKAVPGVEWYQYRARLRCGSGDRYAVAAGGVPGYEEYCRNHLGLGRAGLVRLRGGSATDLSLAHRLGEDPTALDALARWARGAGRVRIDPYMGIEPVWALAERLARMAERPVHVLGPPPAVTRMVNDKARFSRIVEELLGADALARTSVSSDPRELAEHLRREVGAVPAVALKMPSCASGMGNRIFLSDALRGRPAAAYLELVERFLAEKEWDGVEPVLVVEWHRDVLESPSTQCWIPPRGGGEPAVEEVFQQLLAGEEQVFQGAMLSALPLTLRRTFMVRSWLLCRVFQELGYVGRCSFDALVVGRTLREATVRFVECNGRWGGTSTPMHLMKRVFGDFRTIPYRAQGYSDPRLRGLGFTELADLLGRQLYDRRSGRGRVLLYNPGPLTEHGRFDMIVTGRSHAAVDAFISRTLPALIARRRGRGPARA